MENREKIGIPITEKFVRDDGVFIPFADDFDISSVTTSVKDVVEIGAVKVIDLQSPINSLIGGQVVKVGRSSWLTTGTVMAYALEFNDEKGIFFFIDFLVVGKNQQSFYLEGDSGSLILLTGQNGEKPRAMGIIWGGTANRGRLNLRSGNGPENWTSGVDLGRLLDLLELDLITTYEGLQEAMQEQRSALAAIIGSTVGESSREKGTLPKDKTREIYEPMGLNTQQLPMEGASGIGLSPPFMHANFHVDGVNTANVEHQFIPNLLGMSPMHQDHGNNPELNNLYSLRDATEEVSVLLQLREGEPEAVFRFHIYLRRLEIIGSCPIVFWVIFKRISYHIIGAGLSHGAN